MVFNIEKIGTLDRKKLNFILFAFLFVDFFCKFTALNLNIPNYFYQL